MCSGASSSGEGEAVIEERQDMIKGDVKDNLIENNRKSWKNATENCRIYSDSFESDKKRRRDFHGKYNNAFRLYYDLNSFQNEE